MDRQTRTQIGTQVSARRTAEAERLWLSTLVGAMEHASQCDDARICEHAALARLRSQLACPASPYPFGASAYSLRN
jgi:hypothetical protein